mmetsp:Transcript_9695/g.19043  ORF Transcript_9695/g.19043 Transcript_9695/m.19043 type:complete len:263 (-) Transcript_9695:55-843(-)
MQQSGAPRTATFGFLLVVVFLVLVVIPGLAQRTASSEQPRPEALSGADQYEEKDCQMGKYPGTAWDRLRTVHQRVKSLSTQELSADWEQVRQKLLWAGGLRDLPNSRPGQGYTGHCFNDFNHVDLTTMRMDVADDENDGTIPYIARGNPLGEGIRIASLPELGEGGSWTTCQIGAGEDPPHDVAHVQFRSAIAFKLVWCPPKFDHFVLVDDDGNLLNQGAPTGRLPLLQDRHANYEVVRASKYARACEALPQASQSASMPVV